MDHDGRDQQRGRRSDDGLGGDAGGGDVPGGGGAAAGEGDVPIEGELAALADDVRAAERRLARAVVRAGRLAGAGVAEREAGLPLDRWLATACQLTGADRATLITAGEVLGDMPVLRGLFLDGLVSWGQVRAITKLVRRRSRADRAWVDQRLGATFTEHEGDLGRVEPDELVAACEQAVDECREVAEREREEAGGVAASFVAVQPDLADGARLYGELDPIASATVVGALDQAAAAPQRDDHGQPATTAASGWSTTTRGRQYAAALEQVCGEWAGGTVAGGDGAAHGDPDGAGGDPKPVTGRRPRPLIRVGVDLAQATAATAGTLDLPVRGPLPRLTAAAVEALVCDATVQAVVCDGARPLATTDKTTAATVPDKIRAAVELRDQGCRWPGCDAPLAHCEVHHLVPRADGGSHHPENLAVLCRRDHLWAHGHGWHLTLDGDTGALAGHRHGTRRWTTHPRGAPLAPATREPPANRNRANGDRGDRDLPDGDRDPPDRGRPSPAADTEADGDRDPPTGWGRIVDDDGNPLPF